MIAMNTMLSMPSTISIAVSASSAVSESTERSEPSSDNSRPEASIMIGVGNVESEFKVPKRPQV